MDPVTTKILVTAVANSTVKPISDSLMTPMLKRISDSIIGARDKKNFLDHINLYLKTSEEKLRIITSIVFPKEGVDIYEIYEPVTLQRRSFGRSFNVIINRLPDRLLSLNKIIVSDSTGMGKSTVLKYLFLSTVRSNKYIPIFIELRRLRKDRDLLQIIKQDIGGIFSNISDKNVVEVVKNGSFLIFLDGLDEIQDDDDDIISRLKDCVRELDGCKFIMSSRPERAEILFPDFKVFSVKPLKKPQAYSIISKISRGNEIGQKLITDLESLRKVDTSLDEFLTNPLLISLLYKAYEYKPSIPEQKHLFYDSVFDALYESHDYKKDGTFRRKKSSGLNYTVFLRITSLLGHLTAHEAKLEFTKTELLQYIKLIKGVASDVEFDESHYLYDICNSVPLFVTEGAIYRWSHKSLQDYFAAYYISNFSSDPIKVVNGILSSTNPLRYISVLDMIKEMKPGFIERNFIIPFLRGFTHFMSNGVKEAILYRRKFYVVDLNVLLSKGKSTTIFKQASDDRMQNIIMNRLGYFQEDPLYVLIENSYNNPEYGLNCLELRFKENINIDELSEIQEISDTSFHTYLEFISDGENSVVRAEVLSEDYCRKIIAKYDNSEEIRKLPDIF